MTTSALHRPPDHRSVPRRHGIAPGLRPRRPGMRPTAGPRPRPGHPGGGEISRFWRWPAPWWAMILRCIGW